MSCEDNNTEIKNIIRETKVLNEIGLVKCTIEILSKIIKSSGLLSSTLNTQKMAGTTSSSEYDVRKDMCEISCLLLETLTEYLIGPC